MPTATERAYIDYLVKRKYPPAIPRVMGLSQLAQSPGQVPPLSDWERNRLAFIRELNQKPSEEIIALVRQEKDKEAAAEQIAREHADQKEFFNQPPATTVDYTHWAKMGTWTVNEAIALSMGRNPKQVNWELIKGKSHSPFVQAYSARQDLVMRGDLPWEHVGMGVARVKPVAFYNWLVKLELTFPEELQRELIKFAGAVDWKKSYEVAMEHNRKLNTKVNELAETLIDKVEQAQAKKEQTEKPLATTEKNTLLKMVYAMAKDAYGFTPGVKGSAASDIEKATTAAGMKLDADTARKWLKFAADYCKELGAE